MIFPAIDQYLYDSYDLIISVVDPWLQGRKLTEAAGMAAILVTTEAPQGRISWGGMVVFRL